MPQETPSTSKEITHSNIHVQKRNGQVVTFNAVRIKNAISNAFKQLNGLPREAQLPEDSIHEVTKLTDKVLSVLEDRALTKNHLTVEEIQDEVIRQLYENGYKEIGELYTNYRKSHAQRRGLFELYSTIKRDGRTVSFKPEKITMAIAKALRAHNIGTLTEDLLVKAQQLSDTIVADIQKLWPQGKAVSIEEIQDLVENALMAADMHNEAKRYILYREEHARARETKVPEFTIDVESLKGIRVKTDKGQEKSFNIDELRFTIETCCQGLSQVSTDKIIKESLKNFYDGITEEQMSAANILAAKSFLETEPNYTFVAARLLLLQEYREAIGHEISFEGMKSEYPIYFTSYIKKAIDLELLNPELLTFDLQFLGKHMDPNRDFLFRYMGLQTLYDRYFIHTDGRRLELPQIFWMRVAMGLASGDGNEKNQRALEFYNILSTFRFISSTPTLFNSGTNHAQLSSCFLTTVEDDLHHIFKCIQDDAMLSKWSGGLGNDWTNVRALGSRIKGTNGKSQGIIPFLKVANDTALAVK